MEKDPNQKKDNSLIPYIFVVLMSLFFLIIIFTNNLMDSAQGIIVAGALILAIVIGVLKITKIMSFKKSGQVTEPNASTSTQPTGSSGKNDELASNNRDSVPAKPTVSHVVPIVGKQFLEWIQKIIAWFLKFSKPKKIMILSGFFIFFFVIIIIISVPGLTGEPDTTITGVWEHELGTLEDDYGQWVIIVTMWNVDRTDTGFLYMNVNENGTFTLTYQDIVVSEGTWEEIDGGYQFLYRDPEHIVAGVYWDYELKGIHLYFDGEVYFTKIEP